MVMFNLMVRSYEDLRLPCVLERFQRKMRKGFLEMAGYTLPTFLHS